MKKDTNLLQLKTCGSSIVVLLFKKAKAFHQHSFSCNFTLLKNEYYMLYTNLKHIESAAEHAKVIRESENTVIVVGNMGSLCVQVYRIIEELEALYKHIAFYDMEYDHPESYVIRNLPNINRLTETPIILFYKSGQLRKTLSGNLLREQIIPMIGKVYETAVKV
jgi:thioredoxin 1